MLSPFSITIFSTTGDPNGIRHIDKSNWSGFGVIFAKDQLADLKDEPSFKQAGLYILVGNASEETIYIGEADPVGDRLKNHGANKEGWTWGVYFVDNNRKIGKTEIQYLEYALLKKAKEIDRAILLNKNSATEPTMSLVARATAKAFLNDMLLVLPILGIAAFTEIKSNIAPEENIQPINSVNSDIFDTVVIPAKEEGFNRVFLGENAWYSIRIQAKHIPKIKYIAAYQVLPIGAITHIAEIEYIKPSHDIGKYILKFKSSAAAITPIPRGINSEITLQAPRYALREKIVNAKWLDDVWN